MTKKFTGTETISFKVILNDGRTGRVVDYNEKYLIYTDDGEEVEVKLNDFRTEIRTAA